MSRLGDLRMKIMALDALEEVLAEAKYCCPERPRTLRLTLGFLARHSDQGRWPFNQFWKALMFKDSVARVANASAALNGIYLAVGVERDHQRVRAIESQVKGCRSVRAAR